jgi:hypothetical protein
MPIIKDTVAREGLELRPPAFSGRMEALFSCGDFGDLLFILALQKEFGCDWAGRD